MNVSTSVTRVTAEEVLERMRRGELLQFVDARGAQAWEESDETIPGSIRIPSEEVAARAGELSPERAVITWCT